MAMRTIFIKKNMPDCFEVFNFVGDENLLLTDFIDKFSEGKNILMNILRKKSMVIITKETQMEVNL